MRFIIHFEHQDNTKDSFIVEGKSLKEIRDRAGEEVSIRGGKNPWSVEIE